MNRKQKGILLALLFILAVIPDLIVKAEESKNTNYAQIDTYLSEATNDFHLPSLSIIIVDKEQVLFSACYGEGSSPDTPYIIGSMSKSFTAAAIMQLVEKGKCSGIWRKSSGARRTGRKLYVPYVFTS